MALFTGHTITPDSALGGKEIKRSIRFNRNDSTQVEKTNLGTSPTSRKISTHSFWFKRSDIADTGMLTMGYGGTGHSAHGFACGRFVSSGRLSVEDQVGNSLNWQIVPSRYFRDTTAWYHIVIAIDTTQSTSSNRVKYYINGVQETDFATSNYPSQNYENQANYSNVRVGAWDGNGYYNGFNGYIAELHSIDGQALDASYFGAFSQTGIWIPKDYTGTYGDNGFYLDFSDNSSTSNIGLDRSGNGHHFNNVSGIQVSAGTGNDSLEDTPTNNFCTLSTEDQYQTTQQNGCLTVTQAADPARVRGTMIMKPNTGKWYYEMTVGSGSSYTFGMKSTLRLGSGTSGNEGRYTYYGHNGYKQDPSSSASYGATYGAGDTVAILYDSDAGHVYFYKNNTSQGLAFTGVNTTDYQPYVYLDNYGTAPNVHFNFGQRPFAYTPPAGARGLSSKNMATPVAAGVVKPQRFFDTLLYTATGNAMTVTGLEFKPDLIWQKRRDSTGGSHFHYWFDSVRGGRYGLQSNTTGAEFDTSDTSNIVFKDGGFDMAATSGGQGNGTGGTYAAWCWKAGGAAVTNTVGNISAQVSANDEAGFSIITYTGDGNSSGNVGTGLRSSQPLDMAIVKRRDNTSDWQVGHRASGQSSNFAYHTNLNDTSTLSGSTPYHMGTQNYTNGDRLYLAEGGLTSSATYVAYVWQERPGYSKFGSYIGNGSSDGPYVNLGFRPAWVMIKNIEASSTAWYILDNKRDPDNPAQQYLAAEDGAAEGTYVFYDFLSHGFKLRNTGSAQNPSGQTIIYMAFAEQPSSTPFGIDANAR